MSLKARTICFALILLFIGFGCYLATAQHMARTTSSNRAVQRPLNDTTIYHAVEVMPEYPGGIGKFQVYIGKNLNLDKETLYGTIQMTFIVEKDGALTYFKVVKTNFNKTMQSRIIALIKNSGKWKPGIQDGKNVRVEYMYYSIFEPST